jgi:hypothetical protein
MNRVDLKETPKEIITPTTIGQTLNGKYKVAVVDKENNVVWEQKDWQKNLILNQGLETLYSYTYANIMYVAFIGNGTAVNSIYTGNSSGSVASTTLTFVPGATGLQSLTGSSGGWASAVQAGDMVKFDDTSEVRILAVSNTSASITPSSTITLQPFTIFKTSQTGLQSPLHVVGSNNFFAGVGYCGTTIVGNVIENRRSWDFNYETSSITVSEVGVGWTTGNGSSPALNDSYVFSRVLLPAPVVIGTAQKMRLIYELDIAITPNANSPGVPFTGSITGWGTGSLVPGYQNVGYYYISSIDTNGGNAGTSYLDPASAPIIFVSNSTLANPNAGTYLDRSGTANAVAATSTDAYIPLSFTAYKNATFATNLMARTDIRTIGLGGAANQPAFCCVFTQDQTKTNVQTLTLSFVYTWGRVLA